MYDRNGLQLSTAQCETLNTYRLTSVDLKIRKYVAYAAADRPKGQSQWAMFKIGTPFKDPRDAAYVAQEFEKQYDKVQVRQMVTDETFYHIAKIFADTIDIPEWKYPAEGLSIEEMLNDDGYKVNYVPDARTALVEVIKIFKLKTPDMKTAKQLIQKVQDEFEKGLTYREAARIVMNVKGT